VRVHPVPAEHKQDQFIERCEGVVERHLGDVIDAVEAGELETKLDEGVRGRWESRVWVIG
jgi:hypothetical protein